MIQSNKEFIEIIFMNMQFNSSVLNFEIEAMHNAVFVRNLDQKNKLSALGDKRIQNHLGIVIVSLAPNEMNKILYTNKNFNYMSEYTSSELLGQNFNFLIPKLL